MNKIDVLLGLQWGDEGKGKIVDCLTPKYDIIARFQGGPNAGHTLEFNGIKHVLHIIPSGIFHKDKINIIGNGVLIEPYIFEKEVFALMSKDVDVNDNLYVSKKSHLILPSHRMLDIANETYRGSTKIGSTLKGIGPTYTDKIARQGLRVGDIKLEGWKDKYSKLKDSHLRLLNSLGFTFDSFRIDNLSFDEYERKWFKALETLERMNFIDSEYYLNNALKEGKKILAEGAQGSMLDIDFGSYPFVTSSNTITSGVCSGLGVAPTVIGKVFGVCKAYCTRVGSGAFPTELFNQDGDKLRVNGNEFGSTTGRPRRCGWIDIPALKYACMLNGVTHLFMMKVDVLNSFNKFSACFEYSIENEITDVLPFDINETEIKPILTEFMGWKKELNGICDFDSLPIQLKRYVQTIEKEIGVDVAIISTSPDRKDTIFRIDI